MSLHHVQGPFITRVVTEDNIALFASATGDNLPLSYRTWRMGQTTAYTVPVSDDSVRSFARVSGDDNPIHLDDSIARRSLFEKRVAHGMLTMAKIGALVRADFPGQILGFDVTFRAPVGIGDEVVVTLGLGEPESPSLKRVQVEATVAGKVVLVASVFVEEDLAEISQPFLIPGLFSAVLGTRLPGPGSIYTKQSVRFYRPLRAGDEVRTFAVLVDSRDTRHGRSMGVELFCKSGNELLAAGRADVLYNEALAGLLQDYAARAA